MNKIKTFLQMTLVVIAVFAMAGISQGADPWVDTDKDVYDSGEDIIVSWGNASGSAKDWIGFYNDGAAHGSYISYIYLGAEIEGELTYDGFADQGDYDIRLFFNDSYTLEASCDVSVLAELKAHNPLPYNGATRIWAGIDSISWDAGFEADSYDVYFGTNPTPGSGEFKGNQTETTYQLPAALDIDTTYYWRIDAVNGGTITGDVWSFTTNVTPSSGMNTFLVPIPVPGAGWQELAYLAAIPASAAANTDAPSVIALDEAGTIPAKVCEYFGLYNPTNVYTIDPDSSLDVVTCYLAQTFWTTTTSVVLCDDSDYAGALAASALAGRMEVPLLYFDSSTGLSSAALDVIDTDLQCSAALTVNGNSTVTSQLSGIGVSQTSLADDKAIITWMENNGYPIDYLAVCNASDRTIPPLPSKMSDYAPKGSIAAPLLATARNGAVAALTYDTEWNTPYFHTSETKKTPAGVPLDYEAPYKYHQPNNRNWPLGSITINGETHDWTLGREVAPEHEFVVAFIDFNDDGDYGDAGETCPTNSEVTFDGKRYTLNCNAKLTYVPLAPDGFYHYGELRFSHPSDEQLKEKLQEYHDQIGHYPKHMAIVAYPMVLPCAHADHTDPWDDNIMNDVFYADADNDSFLDIAVGRVLGENVTYVTLNAARCVTYEDLVHLPASDLVYHQAYSGSWDSCYYIKPPNWENLGFTVHEWEYLLSEDYNPSGYAILNHDGHSWPYGTAEQKFLDLSSWTVSLVDNGGCSGGRLDAIEHAEGCPIQSHVWTETTPVVLAREGPVCFNAYVRGIGGESDFSRDHFDQAWWYDDVYVDDATLGEAQLYGLNAVREKWGDAAYPYYTFGRMFFGDPAVKLHIPQTPTYAAANVTANGNTLTVHAPETYWVNYAAIENRYIYAGPGLASTWYEGPQWLAVFATYTTDLQVTGMTQEAGVPSPLGWTQIRDGKYYDIDEHHDGTRTIYWRVRLDEFDDQNGTLTQTISSIDYTLTTGGVTAPTVVNSAATNITSSAARLNGEVTDTGGEDPTVTIYWGDNDGVTTPGNWDNSESMGTQGGTFYKDISGLDPSTTYYFRCYATNSGGNDWADSTAQFDTTTTGAEIYVYDITMSGYEPKSGYYAAKATIWIKDSPAGDNIDGATVAGNWSGATSGGDSGDTGGDGKVILESKAVKGGGTFTFTVTNVTATGYTYNSSLNNETSDEITLP